MTEIQDKITRLEQELKDFRRTMRRAMRTSKQQADTVLQSLPVAVIVFDGGETVYDWNERARRMFGREAGHTQRVFLSLILDEPSKQAVMEIMEEVAETGSSDRLGQPFEGVGLRIDGTPFPVELTLGSWLVEVAQDVDGHEVKETVPYFSLICHDITELKQAERARAEHAALVQLDQQKSEFVATVSHELRTPLTGIKGYLGLLLGEHAGPVSPEQMQFLEAALRNVDLVVRRVNDILFLQEGRLVISEGDIFLNEIVLAEVESMQERAQQAGIEFRTIVPPDLPGIRGDEEALKLLVWHLLDNAVKFSPKGGTVMVAVQDQGAFIYCEVTDPGIGIAPEHHDQVFERFYQVDSAATRKFSGVGLGLAIAKQIVEAHGGQINLRSSPELGSRFSFTISKQTRLGDSWQRGGSGQAEAGEGGL